MTLTKRQHQIYEFLRQYRDRRGLSPTLDEIAEAFALSKVTVFEHVRALEAKGYVRKTPNASRSVEIVERDQPREMHPKLEIVGTVAAGSPIEPIETPEPFDLGEWLPPTGTCFVLRVSGDSMIEEHIRDGDYVIVESRPAANNGETVVAILEEEGATLKKFYREDEHVRLQPANPRLEPILRRDVEIRGVVIGVLRRY